jgi:hypothetical protein
MSSRTRGATYEKEVLAILAAKGYVCERAMPKIVWIPRAGRRMPISTSHDFFGAWDIIAKKPGEPTRWIQVTVYERAGRQDKRKEMLVFPENAMDSLELWARIRGGRSPHFRIHYAKDNYAWTGAVELVLKSSPKGDDNGREETEPAAE